MSFITVDHLIRDFRSYRRFPGVRGAIRSLFTREYDVHRAVNDISFTINRGEAVGYVGPNGAGKSTTIKILTGILVPTSGTVRVGKYIPYQNRKEYVKRIGVVFGQRSQLWWDLPLQDSFDLHRDIYQVPQVQFQKTLSFCEELLGIGEFRRFPVRQLSLGQRMRGEMALALLHQPDVLFLDEPTIGLDVFVKDRIRTFLRKANKEFGMTIILTTHDLRDIEEICPRILIVDKGHLAWDGSVNALKSRFGTARTLTIAFDHPQKQIKIPGVTLIKDEGIRKTFRFDKQKIHTPTLFAQLAKKYPMSDVTIGDVDIEEIIRTLYEKLGEKQSLEQEEIDTWSKVRAVRQ